MECDPSVREHLHQAKAALREAHSHVGGHLRTAARHMLSAGIAAIDAAEARRAKPATPADADVPPPPAA